MTCFSTVKAMEIYGFSAKLGCGKNHVAEKYFLPMLPPKPSMIVAYADFFKVEAIVKDGLEREKVFGVKDRKTREILQHRGTEEGRNQYGDDIWVKILEETMNLYYQRGIKRFLITDVRFPNELAQIKRLGGVVFYISAPQRNSERLKIEEDDMSASSHLSETALDNYSDFDYVIYNDPENDVVTQVRDIVQELMTRRKGELTIFCDLDDTICRCNAHYLEVMEQIRKLIYSRLKEVVPRDFFDHFFEDVFWRNNRGYQSRPFYREKYAEVMVEVMKEFAPYLVGDNSSLIKQAYEIGMSIHNFEFEELPGALEAVKKLGEKGNLVIYTVGHRMDQVRKLAKLGLSDRQFEIVDHKDETMIRNLKAKYPSRRYVIIGDSFLSDIQPALKSGLDRAILVGKSKEIPNSPAYFEVGSLAEAVKLVE